MTFTLGTDSFESWKDPNGNPLISIRRDGSVYTYGGVQFADGTKQQSATAVGPPGPPGPGGTTNNNGIDVTQHGVVGDGTTDDTAAMTALLGTIGSANAKLVFPSGCNSLLSTITFPTNITLDFSAGGSIKAKTSTTPAGNAVFVQGNSSENFSGGTTSTVTLSNTTAGNTLVVMVAPYPGFTFLITSVTDSAGNVYPQFTQSLAGQPRNQGAWVASNIAGGSVTITAHANGSLTNCMMMVHEYSGLGPLVTLDAAVSNNSNTTTMSSGSVTTQSGSLLIGFGGQPFNTQTCTAGAGYTQPAGTAGQSTNGYICSEYILSGSGGSTSATQTITTGGNWVYTLIALRPGSATISIFGNILAGPQQIFNNATGTAGYINIQSTEVDKVYPEWWGAGPSATATANTSAIQAAIYGAFGKGRTSGSLASFYNRPLYFSCNYLINAELKLYDVLNFRIIGSGRLFSGIQQGASNKRIFDAQAIAYGTFEDLAFSSSGNQTTSFPLLDIDYNGTSTPTDLKPQFIDFYSCSFNGNGITATGVLVAKSGGAAQGSNINFWDCAWESFTQSGLQFGTPSSYAQNAIVNSVFQGDFQACSMFGVAVYGGGCDIHDTSMENGFSANIGPDNQIGFDCYFEAPQQPCLVENVRSESRRMIAGTNIIARNCYTINQAAFPAPGTTTPVGTIISGSAVGGDGHYYIVTVDSSAFGGVGTPTSTQAATGGSSTSIVNSNASYTVNAFTGFIVSILGGTGIGCYGVVTSNTATTINVSSWLTKYQFVPTNITPDNTSTFIVEPNWGTQTTSGGITWADLNEDCVAGLVNSSTGATIGGVGAAYLENCTFPGDRWNLTGPYVFLKNCKSNRNDWANLSGGDAYNSSQIIPMELDVLNDITIQVNGQTRYQSWTLPRINYNSPKFFSGPLQRNLGSKAVVWSVGGAVSGGQNISACSDVAIGGRSDPLAAASVSRNILECTGTIGRPSPTADKGINVNGTNLDVQGGLPSGSGTPGDINFWLGTTGSSGNTIVDGAKAFTIQGSSGHFINTSGNGDVQGSVSSVSGTTITVSYTKSYANTPTVIVTPVSNSGSFYLSASSNSGFTITYTTSGSATFNYWVIGNQA